MNTIDPRPQYARASEQAAALIKTVRAEQLDGPTPCADFDVRRLLGHIIGGCRRIAVIGEGGDGLAVVPFEDDVADDAWVEMYEKARMRVLAAWESDERLTATVRVPWGDAPGDAALSGYVVEIVAHTWDLSEALGRPMDLDPEIAESTLVMARRLLPEAERDGAAATYYASARPVPEGGGVYEQLAAWLGREPLSRA